jgi:hypothetical protein
MAAEQVADPAGVFRVLLRLDPERPPSIVAAKYLPFVSELRAVFRYGGNDVVLELAFVRAADLTGGLL